MKVLKEKLYKAIDEYGMTDERTVAISQELDKIVCKEQKKLMKPTKKVLVWMAVTPDKFELPIVVKDTARELAEYLGISAETVYKSSRRVNGVNTGRRILSVNIELEGIS
ncbi:aspartyl-phosphate phosphatase Spo0E family protein [uncultured Clostridium sp.]|uniref:aspartyl-phosphate phosphatase Spo0E family protein n=1 Tax=uncultured Clostridium sp. TaxID=59620 RepID=UPI0025F105EB|nr:aspartyl-phosphate phosphatase Spo0E family protein [uncultured Clostridium sp.]MDU4882967.1 aspartyl-phosphate phosphatase Spo0E family protein [Clostridium celatum]MDU7076132.1 aspartyl-phosphate phosphatase Spo0E family protein [Clostridium celatum]